VARRLLLCKVNVLASRAVFDELAQAAEQQGVEWHVALERLERAVQIAAEQRAQELIHEWLADTQGAEAPTTNHDGR